MPVGKRRFPKVQHKMCLLAQGIVTPKKVRFLWTSGLDTSWKEPLKSNPSLYVHSENDSRGSWHLILWTSPLNRLHHLPRLRYQHREPQNRSHQQLQGLKAQQQGAAAGSPADRNAPVPDCLFILHEEDPPFAVLEPDREDVV